jgi:hypothetical protein
LILGGLSSLTKLVAAARDNRASGRSKKVLFFVEKKLALLKFIF